MKTVGRGCVFRSIAFAGLALACLSLPTKAQTRGGTVTLGVEQDIVGFDPLIVGVYDLARSSNAVTPARFLLILTKPENCSRRMASR
jgi:hypothetical protein